MLALAATMVMACNCAQAQQDTSDATPQLYSQGDPTGEEQRALELLNRARMDPAGEGQRIATYMRTTPDGIKVTAQYGLNPDTVAAQIAAFPAVPPLAFNSRLLAAARAHSEDLAPHDGLGPGTESDPLRSHLGYDGSTPADRVRATGYEKGADFRAENYASEMAGPEDAHAGFLIDYGNPEFGHRKIALMANSEREVGIGFATKPAGLNPAYPQCVTEDFGWPGDTVEIVDGRPADHFSILPAPALLTGVVYADANGNGEYDAGEGVAGTIVTMDGGSFYTLTSASGGYALPLVNNDGSNAVGPVTVHIAGLPGEADRTSTVTVVSRTDSVEFGPYLSNLKWDAIVGSPPPPVVTLSGGGVVSRAANDKVLVQVLRRSADVSQPIGVSLRFKGTAVPGVDFQALPATVVIPAGATQIKLRVKALSGNGSSNSTSLIIKVRKVKGADSKVQVTFND